MTAALLLKSWPMPAIDSCIFHSRSYIVAQKARVLEMNSVSILFASFTQCAYLYESFDRCSNFFDRQTQNIIINRLTVKGFKYRYLHFIELDGKNVLYVEY